VSLRLLIIDAVVWVIGGVLVGIVFARRDWRRFAAPGPFTALRAFETRQRYERGLAVRVWKDLLPEAGTWFGGISKRQLPRRAEGSLQRFAAESLRAERVHWTLLLLVPVMLIWNRGWLLAANVVFALVINLPCIIVARYNRLRLTRIALRRT
jgi:glycosyl-4,4'-diaponeurosporenoate acyltransferase